MSRCWGRVLFCAGLLTLAACGDTTPYFESVLAPAGTTTDTVGPYLVEAYVNAAEGVQHLTLRVTDGPDNPRFADIGFVRTLGDDYEGRWQAELPGRPAGSAFYFYLVVVDRLDAAARYPAGAPTAPKSLLKFHIVAAP